MSARSVGHDIRAMRRLRGMTQHELARRSGVSQPWLSRLERGHPGASLCLVLDVVEALGGRATVEPIPEHDGPTLDEWLERFG